MEPQAIRLHNNIDETELDGWRIQLQHDRPIPTPAVFDEDVFVSGGFGSYDYYCLDLKTGRTKWRYCTPDDGPTAGVVADGYIAYNTESCTLEVLTLDGRPVWKHWLGDPLLGQPAIHRGRVFTVYPSVGTHWIGAFELADGTALWRTELGGDVITAPVVVGERVYLSTFDGVVYCFDAKTGRQRWAKPMHATSAPWVHRGAVYVSQRPESGTESERTARVRLNYRGEQAYGLKAAPYFNPVHGQSRKQAAFHEDVAVGFGHAPQAAKLHLAQSLIGEASVSRTWRYQGARPVVSRGVLVDTAGDVLEARRLDSGEVIWEAALPASIEGERRLSAPAVTGDLVWAGSWSGALMGWNIRNGACVFDVRIAAPCHWQPVIHHGWLLAGLEDGSLIGVNTGSRRNTGWAMWGGGPGHNGREGATHRAAA